MNSLTLGESLLGIVTRCVDLHDGRLMSDDDYDLLRMTGSRLVQAAAKRLDEQVATTTSKRKRQPGISDRPCTVCKQGGKLHNRRPDGGLSSWCVDCQKAKAKAYR